MWRRAVSNLVFNAVLYDEAGTVIRITVQSDARGVTIAGDNLGAPITQQQMERMFDRFYRSDKSRSKNSTASAWPSSKPS